MKKSIYSILAVMAAGLMMTACSSSDSDIVESTTNGDEVVAEAAATGTITFSIGNAGTRATRADDIQTDEEKAVESIIVVIFEDASNGVDTSGETDTEGDTETFYEVQDIAGISSETPLVENQEYEFTISEEGHYQIVFIANPSSDLVSTLRNTYQTGEQTITEFKNLVEDQVPETKPMMMESKCFYGIKSAEDTELTSIQLDRIMSRIDILNLADGITIDKAVVKNRTCQTTLINDGTQSLVEDYIDSELTYEMELVGNSYHTDGVDQEEIDDGTVTSTDTVNAYKWKIYSYEHFGDENNPFTITLYYHIGSDTSTIYAHDVKFAKYDDEGNLSEVINLERNYYYLISVSYNGQGYINFALAVADWEEGTEFYVSRDDLVENVTTTERVAD